MTEFNGLLAEIQEKKKTIELKLEAIKIEMKDFELLAEQLKEKVKRENNGESRRNGESADNPEEN